MPVFSFLVYPRQGKETELADKLGALPGCSLFESTKPDVMVLVTDTPDDSAQKSLENQISLFPELKELSMVFAHEDPLETT